MKKILFIILAPLIISGCTLLPGQEPDRDEIRDLPEPSSSPIVDIKDKCGIQSCHGLDISCGPEVPDMCTLEYVIGDFCRNFAKCEVVNDECVLVETSTFDECKSCVEKCSSLTVTEFSEISACEEQCRMELLPAE